MTPDDAKEGLEGEESDGDLMEVHRSTPEEVKKSEPGERTDDPLRMYLREMGSVELLSRKGEIAISKRIEAGREAMIAGLCESPLTFQAIATWRDELSDGSVFLHDIIDLEALYASLGKVEPSDDRAKRAVYPPGADGPTCSTGQPEAGALGEGNLDDDELEHVMSLAAIEAELTPNVLASFDKIVDSYKRLHLLQDERIHQNAAQ
jgi:RNA polymerase primary sigma factor